MESQFARKTDHLIEGHVDEIRAAHPRGLDATTIASVRVVPALGRVEIRTDITRKALGFLPELSAIESADGVISIPLNEHPLLVVRVSIDGQLEKIRTFKKL